MSLMRKIWNAIRNPVRHAGRDLEGNTYFESKSYNDPSRMKRTVQYHDPDDMWKYIGGGKRLPVQWSAWLTHTRRHPPTLEELEADLNRQRRVHSNVLKIEARDKAEADEMKRVRQQSAHTAIEDAVNIRAGRMLPNGQPATPKPILEAQEIPLHSFSTVLPPKFVTPPTSRKAKPSKPFPAFPPLDSDSRVAEIQSRDSTQTQSRDASSPWKTTPTDMESWAPKTRKRG